MVKQRQQVDRNGDRDDPDDPEFTADPAEFWAGETYRLDCAGRFVFARLMEIKPAAAERWLDAYGGQNFRRMNGRYVNQFTDHFNDGTWRFNSATVAFNLQGPQLLDGQKRLKACALSGKSFVSLVVLGDFDPMTIDTNQVRTLAQFLENQQVPYGNVVAAATVWLWKIENNREANTNVGVGVRQLLEVFYRHRDGLLAAIHATKGAGHRPFMPPHSMVAVVHYLASLKTPKTADDFYGKLLTGVGLGDNDPILLLRNRMLKESDSKYKLPGTEKMALIIIAWNKWSAGETVKVLKWAPVGPAAQAFPKLLSIPNQE